jgi:hypothetical protein
LLDEQPIDSAYSIADAMRVLYSTILNHLRGLLGMDFFDLRWTADGLTEGSQCDPLDTCRELLPIRKAREKSKSRRVVTDNESWSASRFHISTKRSISRNDLAQKVKQQTWMRDPRRMRWLVGGLRICGGIRRNSLLPGRCHLVVKS